jgi:hypothetical protein
VDGGGVFVSAGGGGWGDSVDSAFASGDDADSRCAAGTFYQYVGESGSATCTGYCERARAYSVPDSHSEDLFSSVPAGGAGGEVSSRAHRGEFPNLAGYAGLRANSNIANHGLASDAGIH